MRSSILTMKRARRLRSEMTKPEVILWSSLRRESLAGLRFRRQHPIGPYILDFYCPSARLCVEIDGMVHASPAAGAHDDRRTAWLQAHEVRVLRIAAADVLNADLLPDVIATIAQAAAPSVAFGATSPVTSSQGRM